MGTWITSPSDTLKLDYDALGRTVRQQRVFGGTTYVLSKAYDAGGYLQSITYPDNDTLGSLGYDEAGRLKTIPWLVNSMTYDAAGRPLTRANANLTTTTWTYTPDRGFLQRIYTTPPTGPALQDLTYSYDAAGIVQSVSSPFSNEGWTYQYDDFYHLIQATNTSNSANSQSFTYDAGDRITSNSRSGIATYNYQAPAPPHAPLTVNGGPTRLYDLNGNLTSASVSGVSQTLTWDGENRLSKAVVGSTTTTFAYDSTTERLKKTSGSNTSIYPFGDDYEITNGTITKYISVDGLGVVAKVVGTGTSAQLYWIHPDCTSK